MSRRLGLRPWGWSRMRVFMLKFRVGGGEGGWVKDGVDWIQGRMAGSNPCKVCAEAVERRLRLGSFVGGGRAEVRWGWRDPGVAGAFKACVGGAVGLGIGVD
eukprot:73391-Chlamydomonas_euryale.AAC.1